MILINADKLLEGLIIGYNHAVDYLPELRRTLYAINAQQVEEIANRLKNEMYSPLQSHMMTIVGTLHQSDPIQLKQTSIACSPTATDETAYIAIAYMTKLAHDKVPLSEWFSKIWEFCSGENDEFDSTFRKIGHVMGFGSQRHAIRHLGTGETANQIATIAFYCILRHPDDILQALDCVIIAPKNKIQICMLTGAISSLYNCT